MKRIYFRGFNEIRALAALAVLFHHVELYKTRMRIPTFYDTYFKTFIKYMGQHGVAVFFTLSGFLITYLLLEEKEKTSNISIRQFYIRRVLRIWPVYYIVVIIGFLIVPFLGNFDFFSHQTFYNTLIFKLEYDWNLLLYLLIFANVATGLYSKVAGASHAWTVSVEEQFYLGWPWIIRSINKYLNVFFLVVIFGYYLITHFYNKRFDDFIHPTFKIWLFSLQLHFLAAGALAANLFRTKNGVILKWQNIKVINWLVLSLFIIHLLFNISSLVFSFSCAYLILLAANNKGISNKWLDKIGVYSYGVYMYHPFLMYIMFAVTAHFINKNNLLIFNCLSYVLILGGTFVASYLSYRYIEKPLLTLKEKFAVVKSNNLQ